ncbi:thioredoxin family protein [Marichromatium bheemlicum]|uniref:Thioredoxin fold domain-containing protein n=1 Tax=Marichromatium bheemlicum TaxID=365339 RepID=A0ABX1IAF9_9GAMM|nr:thioredoxin fold domain-containing protein [Marichromatium bheemlicum]NKN34522.1 thioredoxin fold domain-containing protein [Marichromatium bheemlicum]
MRPIGSPPLASALILTLAGLLLPLQAQATEPPGRLLGVKTSEHPTWFKESFLEITEDVAEASAAGRHLILFMEMNGCPYCDKMVEENFKHAPYRDFIRAHFDVIALNVKGDREVAITPETRLPEKRLAEFYEVNATPTLIFLDATNTPVVKIGGYRNPEDFKRILDYVSTHAYAEQSLAAYLRSHREHDRYQLRAHPQIREVADLSAIEGPLAILFEDDACVACDALHDGHLAAPEVREALAAFTLVRLDTGAETPIIAPDGTATTARAFARKLDILYRPTLVLFDQGEVRARIDSMLYRYHFIGLLEYVGAGHYQHHPDPFDYIDAKTAALLAAGEDVSVSDE